jgi:enamine deaminase RidA (YjgF/YER057c/UK114 family)
VTEPYPGAAAAPHPTDHEGNHPVTEHEHHPAQPDQDGPATDEAPADESAPDESAPDESAPDESAPDVATAAFGAGDEPVDAPVADDAPEYAADQTGDTADQTTDDAATDDSSDIAAAAEETDADTDTDDDADQADDGPTSRSFEALVAGEPAAEPAAAEPVTAEPVAFAPVPSVDVDDHAEQPAAEPGDEDIVEEPAPVVLSGPPSQRLVQLGIALPQVPAPVADYVPAVRSGAHVYTSGQLPFFDGQLTTTGVVGDEAVDVTPEEAAVLARQCALNAIAAVASVVDLDSVVRVVKVTGFVASAPGFAKQPVVVNGASALIGQVFGDAGKHARSAVGVAALPLGAPVEVELVVEVA